jgi:transcriptional regulator GlxA family with amidase domain
MVAHLDQCTSVDDLAHRAYMSRRHFTRQFRAEVGASPWQWLIGQRLMQGRHLLEETDEQIEVISRRCGFPTALAFRTTFKQSVGISPSEYRRFRRAGNRVAV